MDSVDDRDQANELQHFEDGSQTQFISDSGGYVGETEHDGSQLEVTRDELRQLEKVMKEVCLFVGLFVCSREILPYARRLDSVFYFWKGD